MASITKKNSIPYDFTTDGQAGLTATSGGIKSVGLSGELIATGLDTANKTPAISHGGDVLELGLRGKWYYDFATDGGAIGDVTLRGPKLPLGAVVTGGYIYNTTAMTSGGSATVAINIPTDDAAGIKAATAYGTIGAAGPVAIIQTGAAANISEITTDERDITITIATAALTAGAFVLVLNYDIVKADTTS
jgi:hypothetical protein